MKGSDDTFFSTIDYKQNKINFTNWSSYEAYEDTKLENHYFYVRVSKEGHGLQIFKAKNKEEFISSLNFR